MEVFPKRKELANAQTAFRSSRKNLHFSSRSSTKCRSLFRLVGINFALLVFGLICFCLCVRKREKNLPQRAKRCCEECPASLFEREMEGEVWSVKKEKLFERSEFFSFSGMPDRSSSKVQTAVFLFCYLFLSAGRKKKVRITSSKITLPQYTQKVAYRMDVW